MAKIIMRTLAAGPDGVLLLGKTYTVGDATAQRLVEAGACQVVEATRPTRQPEEGPEEATRQPEEGPEEATRRPGSKKAVSRRGRKPRGAKGKA